MFSYISRFSTRVSALRYFSTTKTQLAYDARLPSEDVDLLGKGVQQNKKKQEEESHEPEYVNPDIKIEEDTGARINIKTGEVNGPKGPEPTRFGDYEVGGRCFDF